MSIGSASANVGFYMDGSSLAVVSGRSQGASVKIDGFVESEGSYALEASPESKQRILDEINQALRRSGIKSKSVRLTMPGDASITRHFHLPILPKKEERNAVRFEAQKYIPFEVKDLLYDYDSYPSPDKKRQTIVFFACKKQRVEALETLFQLGGLKIGSVELACQSLARAYHRLKGSSSDGPSLVIAANADKTAEIVIQKSGAVLTTRHLSMAFAADGTTLDIPQFVSEVRISLDYFKDTFGHLNVEKIFVVSPFPGNVESLSQALEKEFGLSISTGSLCIQAKLAGVPGSAAQGAALTSASKNERRINLKSSEAQAAPVLTWEEEQKKLQQLVTKEIAVIAATLALIFFVTGSLVGGQRQKLNAAMSKFPKSKSVSLTEKVDVLKKKEAESRQKLAFLKSFLGVRVYFTHKLSRLAELTGDHLLLTQLSYSDAISESGRSVPTLRIDGIVIRADEGAELNMVNDYVGSLKADPDFMAGFADVVIQSTKRGQYRNQQKLRFTIDCLSGKPGA